MKFEEWFNKYNVIITEGAIIERLKNEYNAVMDKHVNHAGLIYKRRDILAGLYEQYIDIAVKYDLPIMLMTPTRKVNFETLKKSEFNGKNIIGDSCKFLTNIKLDSKKFAGKISIGGLLGCRGDAYSAVDALSTKEAFKFHKVQADIFAREKPDYLFAGIMPAISEAVGMAQAMSSSGIPYIISFMMRKNGMLLDGTPIAEAIMIIDSETEPKPLCYFANCIHPLNLKLALKEKINFGSPYLHRFKGVQANASELSPEELNNSGVLQKGNFDKMTAEMMILKKEFGIKVLGGCCGTDNVFIEKLAKSLK